MENENIITFIKNDHRALKESIQILISENAKPALKKSALKKFLIDFKLHAKSEEFSLYDNMVDQNEVHESILEGYEEHSIAELLVDELEAISWDLEFTDETQAKAKVLAELVKLHVENEEEKMLVDLRKAVTEKELERLGLLYKKTYKSLSEEFMASRVKIKPEFERDLSI